MAKNDAASASEVTQAEWDRINRYAQSRKGRAQWLSLERAYGDECALPAPRQGKSAAAKAELFNNAAEVLRRIGTDELSVHSLPFAEPDTDASTQVLIDEVVRHLSIVSDTPDTDGDTNGWHAPVDWSECVEGETVGHHAAEPSVDLTENGAETGLAQELIELREREIELRDGRMIFEHVSAEGRRKLWRREAHAWKQLGDS